MSNLPSVRSPISRAAPRTSIVSALTGDRVQTRRGVQPLDVAAVAPDAQQRLEPVELGEDRFERGERRRLVSGPGREPQFGSHRDARPLDLYGGRRRCRRAACSHHQGRACGGGEGQAEGHGTIVTCIDLYVTLLVSGLSSTTPKASAWAMK